MTNKLSVIIYTYNEQNNIESAVASAKLLTKNIIVIDSESTDQTAFLAKKTGVLVYSYPHSLYVEPAREFGINKAQTEWVFLLDADERMTKELAVEILRSIEDDTYTHFKIPRKNIFGKSRWLRYGAWWPDYQIRLIKRKYFKSWPKEIHSSPIISGQMGSLQHPIVHYFHGDIESMVNKTIIFENIESDLLFLANKKVTNLTFFRKFFGELFRRLIKYFGFLDGEIGIIESIYQAFSKTITYIYLYEKNLSAGPQGSSLRPLS